MAIKIEKLNTTYKFTYPQLSGEEECFIRVKVDELQKSKRLTITNQHGYDDFKFLVSEPKTVKKIAELLLEAVKLCK